LYNLQALADYAAIAFENIHLYEEAKAEIQAQKQLITLGQAMAAIEHRINNTLNIIVPNINRLRKRVDIGDQDIKEILEIIERNTRYTSFHIDKIRSSSSDFATQEVDINAVLVETVDTQKQIWEADSTQRMHLVPILDLDPFIPKLFLPIGQITEVYTNLLQNAYKQLAKADLKQDFGQTSPWKAILRVTSKRMDGKIMVSIEDNVPGGIPSKIKERLFKRPVPSQTPAEGSGLGLWLSKLIMNSVGGDIFFIEQSDSNGTIFVVEIPLKDDKEERK